MLMCIYVSQNLYRMKKGHWDFQSKQQKCYEMNKEIEINIEKHRKRTISKIILVDKVA